MVVGALFGPRAMQAVMSGQAAVAVIVSGVQVVSSAASVWGQAPESYDAEAATDGKAEANSAFLFFGLSTLFMLGTVWAYMWLRGMPAYKAAVEPMERARQARRSVEEEETTGLVGGRRTRKEEGGNKAQIMRVARANILAEAAVAWVFIVTLVRNLIETPCFRVLNTLPGCLPHYHSDHHTHESRYASPAFQRHPFLCIQRRRLRGPILLLLPSFPYLVTTEAALHLSGTNAVYSPLPHVQRAGWRTCRRRVEATCYQL